MNDTAAAAGDLLAFDRLRDQFERLRREVRKVIVGQEQVVEELLLALLAQGHVLIVGVPGLAKTLLVRTLAAALDLPFRRIQFTPDLMPSDVLGTELIQDDPVTGHRSLRFSPGPIFGQFILADEINRTPPKTQAALLEAMAERQVTAAGRTMPLDAPFLVVATQNPIEQEGTYPLPEAALDRFMFSLWMDYPTREQEQAIVARSPGLAARKVDKVFDRATLLHSMDLVNRMPVSEHVGSFAVALARASRPADAEAPEMVKKYVQWGAGPRAGQYMMQGAKALAALEGEPTPNCQHVRRVAAAVLRHRLVLNYTATGEGLGAHQVVERLLAQVREPHY